MKKLLYFLSSLIVLCGLLISFTPFIASTSIGKKIIESTVSQKLKANISFSSWKLSWFGPQIIQNIQIKDNKIEVSFTEVHLDFPFWSFFKPSQFNQEILKKLNGHAFFKNGEIALYEKNNTIFHLQNLDLNIYRKNDNTTLFNIKANNQNNGTVGSVLIDGKVLDSDNLHNRDVFTSIKTVLFNFPTKSIDKVFQLMKPNLKKHIFEFIKNDPDFLYSTLGEVTNANLLIESKSHNSKITAEISTSNLKTNFDIAFENNKLNLNRDLNISYKIPSYFLGQNIQSIDPINLKISKNDFYIPIDLNIKNLVISNATLDLGKFRCKNEKILATIVKLMKPDIAVSDEMTICFNPFNFDLKDKLLSSKRIDSLIDDKFKVSAYGNLNIINKNLKMTLGISKDTLENIFKIKSLPNDYILEIPLRGILGNLHLNYKKAASKIAKLIITQSTDKKVPELSELLYILEQFD